jgi:hypothetical protein
MAHHRLIAWGRWSPWAFESKRGIEMAKSSTDKGQKQGQGNGQAGPPSKKYRQKSGSGRDNAPPKDGEG